MNTEELKRLAQAATPGPWEYQKDSKDFPINGYVVVRDCIYSVCVLPYEGIRTDDRVTDNGAYIAAANPAAILALIQQRDELLAALELFMERVDEPPEANCSCHISPPCNDCVENWGLREAFSDAKEAIAKAEAQS